MNTGGLAALGLIDIAHEIAWGSAAYFPEANGLVPLSRRKPQSGALAYESIPVRITRAG